MGRHRESRTGIAVLAFIVASATAQFYSPSVPTSQAIQSVKPTLTPANIDCFDRADGLYSTECSRAFVQCANGMTFDRLCPETLVFVQEIGRCDYPSACGLPSETTPSIASDDSSTSNVPYEPSIANETPTSVPPKSGQSSGVVFDCATLSDGSYSSGCTHAFVQCSSGIVYPLECPDGLVFDKRVDACVWPSECSSVSSLPTVSLPSLGSNVPSTLFDMKEEKEQMVTDAPLPRLSNDGTMCTGTGRRSMGKCSSGFVQCIGGKLIARRCPGQSLFDEKIGLCVYDLDGCEMDVDVVETNEQEIALPVTDAPQQDASAPAGYGTERAPISPSYPAQTAQQTTYQQHPQSTSQQQYYQNGYENKDTTNYQTEYQAIPTEQYQPSQQYETGYQAVPTEEYQVGYQPREQYETGYGPSHQYDTSVYESVPQYGAAHSSFGDSSVASLPLSPECDIGSFRRVSACSPSFDSCSPTARQWIRKVCGKSHRFDSSTNRCRPIFEIRECDEPMSSYVPPPVESSSPSVYPNPSTSFEYGVPLSGRDYEEKHVVDPFKGGFQSGRMGSNPFMAIGKTGSFYTEDGLSWIGSAWSEGGERRRGGRRHHKNGHGHDGDYVIVSGNPFGGRGNKELNDEWKGRKEHKGDVRSSLTDGRGHRVKNVVDNFKGHVSHYDAPLGEVNPFAVKRGDGHRRRRGRKNCRRDKHRRREDWDEDDECEEKKEKERPIARKLVELENEDEDDRPVEIEKEENENTESGDAEEKPVESEANEEIADEEADPELLPESIDNEVEEKEEIEEKGETTPYFEEVKNGDEEEEEEEESDDVSMEGEEASNYGENEEEKAEESETEETENAVENLNEDDVEKEFEENGETDYEAKDEDVESPESKENGEKTEEVDEEKNGELNEGIEDRREEETEDISDTEETSVDEERKEEEDGEIPESIEGQTEIEEEEEISEPAEKKEETDDENREESEVKEETEKTEKDTEPVDVESPESIGDTEEEKGNEEVKENEEGETVDETEDGEKEKEEEEEKIEEMEELNDNDDDKEGEETRVDEERKEDNGEIPESIEGQPEIEVNEEEETSNDVEERAEDEAEETENTENLNEDDVDKEFEENGESEADDESKSDDVESPESLEKEEKMEDEAEWSEDKEDETEDISETEETPVDEERMEDDRGIVMTFNENGKKTDEVNEDDEIPVDEEREENDGESPQSNEGRTEIEDDENEKEEEESVVDGEKEESVESPESIEDTEDEETNDDASMEGGNRRRRRSIVYDSSLPAQSRAPRRLSIPRSSRLHRSRFSRLCSSSTSGQAISIGQCRQDFVYCKSARRPVVAACPVGDLFDALVSSCVPTQMCGAEPAKMESPSVTPVIRPSSAPNRDGEKPTMPSPTEKTTTQTTTIVVERDIDCSSVSDGAYALSDCSSHYIVCSGRIKYSYECPTGLIYDKPTDSCQWPKDVAVCAGGVSADVPTTSTSYSGDTVVRDSLATTTPTTISPMHVHFECSKDGGFALDCKGGFVMCSNGAASVMRCPAALVFDDATQACQYPAHVGSCGLSPTSSPSLDTPSTLPPFTQFSSTTSAPARAMEMLVNTPVDKNACSGVSSGVAGVNTECSSIFVICTEGRVNAMMNCPDGTFYDHKTERCDYREVACGGGWSGEAHGVETPIVHDATTVPTEEPEEEYGRRSSRPYLPSLPVAVEKIVKIEKKEEEVKRDEEKPVVIPSTVKSAKGASCDWQGTAPSGVCSSQFITCSNGRPEVFDCTAGLVFASSLSACQYPQFVAGCPQFLESSPSSPSYRPTLPSPSPSSSSPSTSSPASGAVIVDDSSSFTEYSRDHFVSTTTILPLLPVAIGEHTSAKFEATGDHCTFTPSQPAFPLNYCSMTYAVCNADGWAFRTNCTFGNLFDSVIRQCVPSEHCGQPYMKEIVGGSSPTSHVHQSMTHLARDSRCVGVNDGTLKATSLCSSRYIRCEKESVVIEKCSSMAHVFSSLTGRCVLRVQMAECSSAPHGLTPAITLPKTRSPSSSPDGMPPPPSHRGSRVRGGLPIPSSSTSFDVVTFCTTKHVDGLYRRPDNCAGIVQCFGGEAFLYPSCAPGLFFNEIDSQCDYASNVPDCISQVDDLIALDDSFGSCKGQPHGSHLADDSDCSIYYRCVWGSMERLSCPMGTVFNPRLSVCDYPSEVPHCQK